MKKNNKGFSLVELIVVVAIMAVLVGVLAPAYLKYVDKTRLQKDVSAIGEVIQAIKVAGAKEAVADEIPDAAKDTWDTYVTVSGTSVARNASSSGTITTRTTSGSIQADDMQTEVRAIVGTVALKNEVLNERGVELSVVRDENYKIVVTVETYKYKDKPEVREALEKAFGSYADLDLVSKDLQDNASVAYSEEYQKKYTEVYNEMIAEGATVVEAAREATYEATKSALEATVRTQAYLESLANASLWDIFTGAAEDKANAAADKAVQDAQTTITESANNTANAFADELTKANEGVADLAASASATESAKNAAVAEVLLQCENNPEMKAAIEKAAARADMTVEEYVKKELLGY